jgi:hypothetical protein
MLVAALGLTTLVCAEAAPLVWPFAFNWSDSPLLIDLHQYGGFNDNILNSAPGVKPTASAFSQTAVGALGRVSIGSQRFFADARVAATDFLDDKAASRHDRAFHLGWDWRAGAPCKGSLIAASSDTQAEAEQASGPGLDTLRLRALEADGRCALYGAFGLMFAAGAASRRHSAASARALDADSVYGKLGVDYQGRQGDHAAIFAKATGLRFPDAAAPDALPGRSSQTDIQATYRRVFSPLLEAEAMIGASAASAASGAPPLGGRPREIGVYKAELAVTPSALWRIALDASRTLGAPVSIRANAQVAETQTVSLAWRPTPKLSLTASLGRLWLESGPTVPGLYGGSTLITLSGRAVYQFTPFTSFTASLQRAERSLASGRTETTVATIGVDFKPFRAEP